MIKYEAFLIKYGEIGLKGKNRYLFEDALIRQIQFSLKGTGDYEVTKEQGRIYVNMKSDYDYDEVVTALQRVFGIVAICPVVYCSDYSWENLTKTVGDYIEGAYEQKNFTFKVDARLILLLNILLTIRNLFLPLEITSFACLGAIK